MPSLHLDVVAIEKGAFWSPLTTVAKFTTTYYLSRGRYVLNHQYI